MKMRLQLERLSVATFDPGAAGDPQPDSLPTDTQDRSCYEYCGPDDQHTGPTVPGSGC